MLPELQAPVATYAGWNLRSAEIGAENALLSITGSYIPIPVTKSERIAAGDPRQSLEERYSTVENYITKFRGAVDNLVRDGYMLEEDIVRQMEIAERNSRLLK